LQKLSDAELVELQLHKNDWWVRHARRILQERAVADRLRRDTVARLEKLFAEHEDPTRKLRALWALIVIRQCTIAQTPAALKSPHEAVRAWAYRALTDPNAGVAGLTFRAIRGQTERYVAEEPSPFVRLHLASIAQRWGYSLLEGGELIKTLIGHTEDAGDQALSQMYWYALERWYDAPVASEATSICDYTQIPLLRRFAARRATLAWLSKPDASTEATVFKLFGTSPEDDHRNRDVCDGFLESTRGIRNVAAPDSWPPIYAALSASESTEVRKAAKKISVLFGDESTIVALLATLTNESVSVDERREALELLLPKRLPDLLPLVVALLDRAELRSEALRALGTFDNKAVSEAILGRFAKFTDAEKADALQTLASRPPYGLALLDAVEAGRIERRDLSTGVAVQLAGLKNKQVDERLAAVWGAVRPTSEARKKQAERLKQVLSSAAVAAAQPARGRAHFTKHCAACHKLFNEGGKIGPELTGSQRANVDYILENVLDPSAKVGRLYQVTVLELADGRVVQGVVSEENDLSLTVQTTNELLTIAKSDVESRQQTQLSLMPDGLFDKLADEEIRDLMAYLASGIK
jgi:putative heme-binding domain-containing protein